MSLQTQITANIQAVQTKTPNVAAAPGAGDASSTINVGALISLANGTLAGQANLSFTDKRTIAASGTDDLDLYGILSDIFGAIINEGHVKALLITADKGNAAKVTLSGTPSKAFLGPLGGTSPTIDINPGGILLYADPGAGWAVVNSTGDRLRLTNTSSTAPATYSIAIIGTTT